MLNIQLARKYGVAIFEIAEEEKKLEKYGNELAKVSKDLFSHADLKGFLTNPQVQPQAKKDILSKLLQGEISDLMFKFLLLLVDKRRIVLLEAINECYQELSNKARGIMIADVTSAFDLKSELKESLGRKLERVTGKRIKLRMHNDPRIIGGVIVKIGDKRIDGSVTGRLQALKAELMASN
ncbi:MAG: ATP synthase F1 subunit delta [Anaerovibrio sp.]|uniref:ATP synthase F1 subunit delta n=1 Tax=Anaerovibrio sp. TaxID=1872532 RepID=UPI0025CC2FDB|nr:ATP synthase F1 subunit delta [Anaerovibrio sp.]MCR5176163.1 ATP synthase F1 subunit delta [Anaerovibrio sp.]